MLEINLNYLLQETTYISNNREWDRMLLEIREFLTKELVNFEINF
jgi:hypothetical protein